MKCINKYWGFVVAAFLGGLLLSGCSSNSYEQKLSRLETESYERDVYRGEFFAEDLCVTDKDIERTGYETDESLHAAGLFDLNRKEVLYSQKAHEKLYPASTTKIMTAYVALKYGNLDDEVTVSDSILDLDPASSVCGLKVGDQLTLRDLIYGLLLHSGNDNAVAIAEHISGTEEAFVEKMNEEAQLMGATNTHYTNAHGLQNAEHYTTAYDLYLIFNQCVQNDTFREIIETNAYSVNITEADGTVRSDTWKPSNYYQRGLADVPQGITVLGGKTGTTDEAGYCLILYEKDEKGNPYISVVMGAQSRQALYKDMSALMGTIDASSPSSPVFEE